MKTIKDYADEMRTMASMLNEAASALEGYHDRQLQGVLNALGLASPAAASPANETTAQKIRKEYAELPPAQRTLESRLYLARKYSITEAAVSSYLQGPVQNGNLTRK